MKAVILAGGLGTRLSEESGLKPKPLVEVGGMPVLWHIMKTYSHYGVRDFIVCCGYKGYLIKEYFANYFLHMSDVTFDMRDNTTQVLQNYAEPWSVTLVDTGQNTMTGGRLLRVKEYLLDEESFCFTYGDGVADINITNLIECHLRSGCSATVTAARPQGRYGALQLDPSDAVTGFREKPEGEESWINGGYFVLAPSVFDFISDDSTVWEGEPLQNLSKQGELNAYKHYGFWQPMDTLREKQYLNDLWSQAAAPWKVW